MPPLETASQIGQLAAAPAQLGSDLIMGAMNVHEARQNRRFQRDMSNTAHQREVKDLRAAGLNPILSARLGGSSTPGGSAAHLQNSQIGQTITNSALAASQIKLASSQAAQANSQADLNSAHAAAVRGKQGPEIELINKQVEKTGKDILLAASQTGLNDAQKKQLEALLPELLSKLKSEAMLADLQIPEMTAKAGFYKSKMGKASPYVQMIMDVIQPILGAAAAAALVRRLVLPGKKGSPEVLRGPDQYRFDFQK